MTKNFHYEAELVVAIGHEATAIDPAGVEDVILGFAAGIDLTRRDLQLEARDKGARGTSEKGSTRRLPFRPSGPAAISTACQRRVP